MLTALVTVWVYLTFIVICWFFYIAIMRLKTFRSTLHPVAKVIAYYGLAIGLVLDAALNLTASLVLWDVPRELMLTTKLKRLKAGTDWRAKWAAWICEHMLNQFDPRGIHC